MTESQDLCLIYVSQGPLQAEVIKSKLEAAGIPVLLRYEAIGRILGLTVDGLGRVEVLVPPELEGAARDVLREWDESLWHDEGKPIP
jgi:hypothetical protein